MLMAQSGTTATGLRYSTPVHVALSLAYVLCTRNLDEEERVEFDGWHNATAAEAQEWEIEQKERRIAMIHEMGEVG
jgi:hypothetical protein